MYRYTSKPLEGGKMEERKINLMSTEKEKKKLILR